MVCARRGEGWKVYGDLMLKGLCDWNPKLEYPLLTISVWFKWLKLE